MAQQLVEKKGLKNHELARTGRMALYGGGKFASSVLWADIPLTSILCSYLRTCCNNLVQIPTEQNSVAKQEPRNCRQSRCRPNHLCQHQLVRLPQQHGDHGGVEPQG
jgi:hypothetical protein